ncbi:hypothetical protein HT031_005341 [Scenedesmus sp. PABB004]|nr:hypothetical protein HT031_005341 [Scenedesmus sp. PABB004]
MESLLSGGATDSADSFRRMLADVFAWEDGEITSNMGVLFPMLDAPAGAQQPSPPQPPVPLRPQQRALPSAEESLRGALEAALSQWPGRATQHQQQQQQAPEPQRAPPARPAAAQQQRAGHGGAAAAAARAAAAAKHARRFLAVKKHKAKRAQLVGRASRRVRAGAEPPAPPRLPQRRPPPPRGAQVAGLEAEVAAKAAQAEALEAEHRRLTSRLAAIEAAQRNQEVLVAQLANLNLSLGPPDDAAAAGSGDAAGRGALGAPAARGGRGGIARQQQLLKRHAARQQHLQEAPALWARYREYVNGVTARLAGGALAPCLARHHAAGAPPPAPPPPASESPTGVPGPRLDGTGYPPFPGRRQRRRRRRRGGGADSGRLGLYTINLSTGRHDPVRSEFWGRAAREVTLRAEQRSQLEAAWALYERAMAALNAERRALLARLARAAELAEPGAAAAAAVPAGGAAPRDALAAGMALACLRAPGAAARAGAGCLALQRLRPAGHGLDLADHEALLDAVQRNLVRGRAAIMVFGWAMLLSLDNAQIALVAVHCWPYFPLVRAVVGHLLGKAEMQVA